MRHIEKGAEPALFADWKASANAEWQPSWGNLQNPEKAALKRALLEEQGFLCCYCCRRVEDDPDSHVEHLKPRESFANDELDYGNLVVSCQGETGDPPPEHRHCGHSKDNWYDAALFVPPLQHGCGEKFAYTAYGEILPVPGPGGPAAEETIRRLRLDCNRLRRLRRSAIDGVLTDLEQLSSDDLAALRIGLSERDDSGRYVEFHPAILHVLDGLTPTGIGP